jgi:hypothetical protein
LPRTLAAAALISATILSARIDAAVVDAGWSHSRTLVILIGAACALVIVRSGGMVRAEFSLAAEALRLRIGKYKRELPYEQIVSLSYETPFVKPREWLPALVLIDRFGQRWRVPALLDDGERFVSELTAAAGRDDLRSFASAHNLSTRMAATRGRLVWGYMIALAMIVAAFVLLAFAGPSA